MSEKESITNYFKGKTIFITGGSGFIGKAIIEKLLRSCRGLKKIYLLLRSKKGKGLSERLNEITSSPLFDRLKKEFPEQIKKLVLINGDITQLGLGISDLDREILKEEVNIIFHAAASVKFDEFVKDAIISNLRSTRETALLALETKNIEVFLHLSTAYCNTDIGKVVGESLYKAPASWRDAILIAENCDPLTLNKLSEKFIEPFPNTYTFTKRLAEHCINDLLLGKVPTVISRPTVVIGTFEEPFEGWMDNFNGPVGLLLAGGLGLLRTIYADPQIDTDYNCVDNTVKAMIVSLWKKAINQDSNELSIYNISKNNLIKYKLGQFSELGESLYWIVPFESKIWMPWNRITTCYYEYYIKVLFLHMLPAFLLDIGLKLAGHRPILFKVQRKIYIATMAVSYFMFNQWSFSNDNMMNLIHDLQIRDRAEFNFLVFPLTSTEIFNLYWMSGKYARVHFMKESKEITEANKTKTLRMYYLDKAVKMGLLIFIVWLFTIKINIPLKLWTMIYNYIDGLEA